MSVTPDVDVAVVGLGTMGSMALWQLSRRAGLTVAGFEQYGIGHAHGAFAGESRLFRAAYHEGAFYVPMLLRARELWLELNALTGKDLFLPIGTLSVGAPDVEPMQNVLMSATEHGLPHERLDAEELKRRYPQFCVDSGSVAVLDKFGGALRPEQAVLSAIALAGENGATVFAGERVTDVRVAGDHVVIATDQRQVTAETAIVAAGPWATQLSPEVAARIDVAAVVLTWFLPDAIEDFLPDRFPTFIVDQGDVHFFGAPSVDNYTVKISGAERVRVTDLDATGWRIDPALLSMIGRNTHAIFPALSPEPSRYSIHPESWTADKVPIIDRGSDGRIVTLTGFSGHGFKFAPIIGEMAAALAVDGTHPLWDPAFALSAHALVR